MDYKVKKNEVCAVLKNMRCQYNLILLVKCAYINVLNRPKDTVKYMCGALYDDKIYSYLKTSRTLHSSHKGHQYNKSI